MAKCKGCGVKTTGCTGYCRTCKFGMRLGNRYARVNHLLVEQVIVGKPGSAWYAWDEIGNVLAGPANTKHEALMELSDLAKE